MQAEPARPHTLPPRRVGPAALVLGVAVAHALLLWPEAPPPASPGPAAGPTAPVVWQLLGPARPASADPAATAIVVQAPAAATGRTAGPAVRLDAAPPRTPPAAAAPAAGPAGRASPPTAAIATAPRPARAASTATRRPDPAAPEALAAAGDSGPAPAASLPPPATEPVPVYATQLPPPARLHYRLQRDGAAGQARLDWEADGLQYLLRLQGEVDGRPLGGASSRGAIDADGLAPVRLADLKRGREVRAANFRRDQQRITFSAPAIEQPLLPGTQDRLSWMIQLPAVVQANPELRHAGARVTLRVVGTRGDAEAWHFDAQGAEPVELPGGAVAAALRFVRAPVRPYDLQVEVWLDPARGHLPVRARLATRPETRTTEWRLAAVEIP